MSQPYYIPEPVLRHLEGKALFYPHSRYDLEEPIAVFAPWIADFWFVDAEYFDARHPADKAKYALADRGTYEPLGFTLTGPPVDPSGRTYGDIEPCVRTETYRHRATGKQFRVHRRRGYSATGFRVESFTLGVFFYRGDSSEGSSTAWLSLSRKHRDGGFILEILNKLIEGGLLVTDGSRCPNFRRNPYKELRRFSDSGTTGVAAMNEAMPFTDPQGRAFHCVGYAGPRNGPTLAWQVTRPEVDQGQRAEQGEAGTD